jgi:hypothetical protein
VKLKVKIKPVANEVTLKPGEVEAARAAMSPVPPDEEDEDNEETRCVVAVFFFF